MCSVVAAVLQDMGLFIFVMLFCEMTHAFFCNVAKLCKAALLSE